MLPFFFFLLSVLLFTNKSDRLKREIIFQLQLAFDYKTWTIRLGSIEVTMLYKITNRMFHMEQFKQNDVLLLHRNSEAEKTKTNYYGLQHEQQKSQLQNQHLFLCLIKKENKNIILCEFCRKIFICLAYSLLLQ